MSQRVVFLHTVLSVVPLFADLARQVLPPDVEAWHVADEILAKVVVAQGGLSPFIYRRVAEHARAAEEAGADALQITCSSVSPCAEVVRAQVGIPVLAIDDAVADQALALGGRIGVAATAPTALRATSEAIRARAARSGRSVAVEAALCEGAYARLTAGDLAEHDRIVRQALAELSRRCDVIVLAQASMTRAADGIPPGQAVPVLSSPRPAMERLARLLRGDEPQAGHPQTAS